MFYKFLKTAAAVLLITSMTVMTVFADDVSDLTKKKNDAQNDMDKLRNELSYLLVQMDELETKMADSATRIDEVTKQLEESEAAQKQQYKDMKLRIKYMYEDQSTSMMEALLAAEDMSQILNKAEYMQQVYDYDRGKLEEMAQTSAKISEQKAALEAEQKSLQDAQNELTDKQSLLYTTIAEQEKKVADFSSQLNRAVAAAAARSAAASSSNNKYVPTGDSSVGSAIVKKAYEYLGTPYRSGGASPGGFDCSGFTSYVFGQFGIGLSRSSGSQAYGGTNVGSLSNALPGDIICYPGHVAIYIGNGQIIHASVPGDYVKIASANIMTITSIRRYW
ncbi:MAG: NlpC/P60 family protein [Clostridia bacterium]|nr:NlpC/P60 family protein [Clostridia bacterium]